MAADDPREQASGAVVEGRFGRSTGDAPSGGPADDAAPDAAGSGPGEGAGGGRAGRGAGGGGGDGPGPGGNGSAGLVVDPRMRSRRIRVRRSEGRRRLRRLTLALAGVAVLVLAAVVTQTALLDVDHVQVTGVEGDRAGEVLDAAAVAPDQPLVSLDGEAVARRVEDLPWVASAQVSRSWPATVRVRVSMRRVVAAIQVTDDHVALVDAEGVVVSIEPGAAGGAAPAGGPAEDGDGPEGPGAEPAGPTPGDAAGDPLAPTLVLTGIDGRIAEGEPLDDDARHAIAVASAVAERMPGTVASVSTDLEAELLQGGVVRFGSTEDLDEKITAVKTVLSDVDTACMAVLDVRVPGSPALTRNQGCS